jgi:uncharacterized protein YbjQ (UPF0145 family)
MKDVQARTGISLSTAERLEGYRIVDYHGLVSGQSVMGVNFVKDFFARIRDVAGGRVRGYESGLDDAMGVALEQMALRAEQLGANAIIAIDVDTGSIGPRMLMASCYGTAVRLERLQTPETEYANPHLG